MQRPPSLFLQKAREKGSFFYNQSFFVISPIKSIPFFKFSRDHLRSILGITCGRGSFAVHFGDHFRSRDHLRLGIICGTVQNSFICQIHFLFLLKTIRFNEQRKTNAINFVQVVFSCILETSYGKRAAHCKTLEWQVRNKKININSMEHAQKQHFSFNSRKRSSPFEPLLKISRSWIEPML